MRSQVLLGGALLAMLSGCAAGPLEPRTATIAAAPEGTYIDPDIAAGYTRYKAPLEPYGTWYGDAHYGVRWCPRDVEASFSAYQSRGHWQGATQESDAPGNAPPSSADSPYWVSDDAETWGDITMHHGYWVKNDWGRSCWIPGTEETPGRVVWRSGNGYVGWAAEPPNWVDETYDASAVLLDWTFVLLGALFQPRIQEQCLCGEETREAAVHATRPMVGEGTRKNARRGPAQAEVNAAENALRGHVAANPTVDADASGPVVAAAPTGISGRAAGSSTAAKKNDTSSTGSKESNSASLIKVTVSPLPPGEEVFLRLRRYPYQGPAGLAPTGSALLAPHRIENPDTPAHIYPAAGPASGGRDTSVGSATTGSASTSLPSTATARARDASRSVAPASRSSTVLRSSVASTSSSIRGSSVSASASSSSSSSKSSSKSSSSSSSSSRPSSTSRRK